MKTILIFGLPGAGKTTLATKLADKIDADWYNADEIRKLADDWDFSDEGRLRQCHRMKALCTNSNLNSRHAVADFVCPRNAYREIFAPDISIWMDTRKEGRYEDTNKIFERPEGLKIHSGDFEIDYTSWWNPDFTEAWANLIALKVNNG